jgi:hypothetical protein
VNSVNERSVFSMPPYVPYGLRGLPSRLYPKCNRSVEMAITFKIVSHLLWLFKDALSISDHVELNARVIRK